MGKRGVGWGLELVTQTLDCETFGDAHQGHQLFPS